jgi:hypothetical protein
MTLSVLRLFFFYFQSTTNRTKPIFTFLCDCNIFDFTFNWNMFFPLYFSNFRY